MTGEKQKIGIRWGVAGVVAGLVLRFLAKPLSWNPMFGDVRRLNDGRYEFWSDISLVVIVSGAAMLLMVFHRWLGSENNGEKGSGVDS